MMHPSRRGGGGRRVVRHVGEGHGVHHGHAGHPHGHHRHAVRHPVHRHSRLRLHVHCRGNVLDLHRPAQHALLHGRLRRLRLRPREVLRPGHRHAEGRLRAQALPHHGGLGGLLHLLGHHGRRRGGRRRRPDGAGVRPGGPGHGHPRGEAAHLLQPRRDRHPEARLRPQAHPHRHVAERGVSPLRHGPVRVGGHLGDHRAPLRVNGFAIGRGRRHHPEALREVRRVGRVAPGPPCPRRHRDHRRGAPAPVGDRAALAGHRDGPLDVERLRHRADGHSRGRHGNRRGRPPTI
mmetsp:Transcript_30266/g.85356  ORF Transcript_30266/g.85356 Transcript_30266/m.85356 type:complete len:291 (+) Transcript_30266:748-1620(+)